MAMSVHRQLMDILQRHMQVGLPGNLMGGGGTHGKGRFVLAWERGTNMGMCCSHDPFFQARRSSLAYQFTTNALLMCPKGPPDF